ncbi:response regulator [Rhodophyticola porphyridii]|uniref:Response regulatory domain-containing protein n=1 Tax=Rhodophyticola porphyridii TaxID=1852017 RepID=A0A3L9YAU7_9RHOB|nr:hypothetical protein [Rhodophyticola porphyridii]RMA43086.1 hypothetical protein D9R08_05485 [Rhodophyticola porphyridii]
MSPVFLVIEADPFVRQDLSEILQMSAEGARVLCAEALEDARGLMAEIAQVDLVFFGTPAAPVGVADLVEQVRNLGGTPVFIGGPETPSATERMALFLSSPFTNTSVAELVADWQNSGRLKG